MVIREVRARVLEGRPLKGVHFAIGSYDVYASVLVEVETDDGLIGYGEAIARRGAPMTRAAVESLLGPALTGEDPRNIEGLWVKMMDLLRRWGHTRGTVVEAISGVDIALWDLCGKAEGSSIASLLHGSGRREVPCYASSVYMADIDTMVREAAEQAEKGFTAIKIKIGRSADASGIAADLTAVAEIRRAVGESVELMVDANGAYDAATAIRVARQLERENIAWLEEPVPPDDREGYARVHAMTAVPLASGETEFSLFAFRELIERRLIDVVQPDAARCGGITGMRHVATLAYAHNLALAPHTGFSGGISQLAALQAAAAAPTLATFEYMFIDNPVRELFQEPYPFPHGSCLPVPEGPGLGIAVDVGRVASLTAG